MTDTQIDWTDHTIEWSEQQVIDHVASEVSELSDVDVAFGNYLALILDKHKVASNKRKDKGAKAFFERPISETLFIGEYEEPRRFMRALVGSGQARKSAIEGSMTEMLKNRVNKGALPIVYFYRNRGIRPVDPSLDNNVAGAITNDKGEYDVFKVEVDYTLFVLSFDTPTLDRISNAFLSSFWFDSPSFTTRSIIDDDAMTMDSKLYNPKQIEFIDVSESSSESRLLAHQATITVQSEQIRMRQNTTKEVNYFVEQLQVIR